MGAHDDVCVDCGVGRFGLCDCVCFAKVKVLRLDREGEGGYLKIMDGMMEFWIKWVWWRAGGSGCLLGL